MNESDKYFDCQSAVLNEFLDRSRPLLDERDERERAYILEYPKGRIEKLEEAMKSGTLALHIAHQQYHRIEENARRSVYRGVVKSRIINSKLAQARAKYRGEESCIVDETRIKLESSRELNDLWRESVEHQAAM